MTSTPLRIARRALALLALLGVAGGVVAPACEGMAVKPPAAQHCGDAGGHGTPASKAPHAPSHQDHPVACAMGICVAVALPAALAPVRSGPIVMVASSVESPLASTAPQHTTPPPRS